MSDTYDLDNFENDTIKKYQTDINKYLLLIKSGRAKIDDYASLFFVYDAMYEFTSDNKGGPRVSKETVDKAANDLFALIKEELKQTDPLKKGTAYIYLAQICHYRKDDKKAFECYNRAVELDKSFLSYRASFKNTVLNDKQGALADYNEALINAKDQDDIDMIKFAIEYIDIHRDTDKLLSEAEWMNVKLVLLAIGVVLYIIYSIFKCLFH